MFKASVAAGPRPPMRAVTKPAKMRPKTGRAIVRTASRTGAFWSGQAAVLSDLGAAHKTGEAEAAERR